MTNEIVPGVWYDDQIIVLYNKGTNGGRPLTYKEIGHELGISKNLVNRRIRSMLRHGELDYRRETQRTKQ